MTKIFIDYNDQVYGRGRYRVRPALQPNGAMPNLSVGTHVLVSDPDEDDEIEAVMEFDSKTNSWVADTVAASRVAAAEASAEYAR